MFVKYLMEWGRVFGIAFKPFHYTLKVLHFTVLFSILYKEKGRFTTSITVNRVK